MLDLFVIESGQPKANPVKLIESFCGRVNKLAIVDCFSDINEAEKDSDWFGVFYDNEVIEESLAVALDVFFEQSSADVLSLYRATDDGEKPASISPRFFRKNVKIKEDCLNAVDDSLTFDRVLNGWIYTNGSEHNTVPSDAGQVGSDCKG